jgi:hypothetical protein
MSIAEQKPLELGARVRPWHVEQMRVRWAGQVVSRLRPSEKISTESTKSKNVAERQELSVYFAQLEDLYRIIA